MTQPAADFATRILHAQRMTYVHHGNPPRVIWDRQTRQWLMGDDDIRFTLLEKRHPGVPGVPQRGEEKEQGMTTIDGIANFLDPPNFHLDLVLPRTHARENANRMPTSGKTKRLCTQNPLCSPDNSGNGHFGRQDDVHTWRPSTHTRCQISNAKRE